MKTQARRRPIGVDLFAGAGGMSLGFEQAGFDVAAARQRAQRGGSLGLLSMEERVTLVGGHFNCTAAPGQGARIVAHLPLPAPPPSAPMNEEGSPS